MLKHPFFQGGNKEILKSTCVENIIWIIYYARCLGYGINLNLFKNLVICIVNFTQVNCIFPSVMLVAEDLAKGNMNVLIRLSLH